ncbi:UPF0225 protein [Seminavis robusta]|uniref:UPF0225 protein n=1 Tax=Seminavis robusta TaxID=568900 RepID=A0A9N8HV31_9STRA|nr:UPF0225 protein [Seminavis robusta]|eukprot:Sro1920_g305510.1 UPF0225 protein (228) ;mRNA; f:13839-14522
MTTSRFLLLLLVLRSAASFQPVATTTAHHHSTTSLSAKKTSSNKKKVRPSTSGFGGAATEPCPCGKSSDTSYMKCCGKLHKNMFEFQKATPEQIVRARYTAYAKREIDFIIQSTHPKNANFQADIAHWRSQIDTNCYDNFELTKCEILDFDPVDDANTKTATVKFVANMIQRDSREKTAFQETSTFEKVGPVWLYREGKIEDPPGRENETETDGEDVEAEEEEGAAP